MGIFIYAFVLIFIGLSFENGLPLYFKSNANVSETIEGTKENINENEEYEIESVDIEVEEEIPTISPKSTIESSSTNTPIDTFTQTPTIEVKQETLVENKPTNNENVNSNPIVEATPTPTQSLEENQNILENSTSNENLNENENETIEEKPLEKIEDILLYEYSDEVVLGEIIRETIDENGIKTIVYSLGPDTTKLEENNKLKKQRLATRPATNVGISIDGDFSDWNDKPMSYEYNWDNSENCWTYGVWINGECFKTPRGTYDTNVRHGMTLLSDGEYLYLHIIYSKDYGVGINGDDFNFYVDGIGAKFGLRVNGESFSNAYYNLAPGLYNTDSIHHGDGSISFQVVDNAEGRLLIKGDKKNSELEFRIPLSELKRQNNSIDLDNIGQIEFFTPNLMYRRLYAGGSNTGIVIGTTFCLGILGIGLYFNQKVSKKEKESVGN